MPPIMPKTSLMSARVPIAKAIATRLKERLRPLPGYAALRFCYHFMRDGRFRADQVFRLTRQENRFQYRSVTADNRYPRIFQFVRGQLADRTGLRLLSFGCSTGEEVFTLRHYFPGATIKGIDINPRNIAICQDRLRRDRDSGMTFDLANSTEQEETAAYDAIFCMAVLRHGALAAPAAPRCDHIIRFADFERIVGDFARCLRIGGLLVIRHSNFRFCDTAAAYGFETVLRLGTGQPVPDTPLYGRDNRRLVGAVYDDVAFRKRDTGHG